MATPSLLMIPSGYKASKLYSVLPEDGTGDFTVSRNSVANRVNSAGLLESMAVNVPRLDYSDGVCPALLTEPQSTNIIAYPVSFGNAYWSKANSTIVSNIAISPDGTLNSSNSIPDAITNTVRLYSAITSIGGSYTFSYYVKSSGRQFIQLLFGSGLNGSDYANFDLINGTKTSGTVGEIETLINGWYRISISATLAVATNQAYLWHIDTGTSARGAATTGNGIDGIYVYGAQVEALSYPTSLIYNGTEGAQVTRLQDEVSKSGISSLINSVEGTLCFEIKDFQSGGGSRGISISDGSSNNRIYSYFYSTSEIIYLDVNIGGSVIVNALQIPVTDISLYNKFAVRWKSNDYSIWFNGSESEQLSGIVPASDIYDKIEYTTGIGADSTVLYKKYLSDAEVITLTT